MFRYIIPTILILVAIGGFFLLAKPLFGDISLKKSEIKSYDEALNNSKALESLRDSLTQEYNSFSQSDLSRLEKLLPDSVDNIRLILEIEKIAAPYGMVLRDVDYDVYAGQEKNGTPAQSRVSSVKDYGAWNLQFSTQATYNNFINFLKDLEKNLRVVDLVSVEFSSNAGRGATPNSSLPEVYRFNFKLKTYWLKN